MADYICSVSHEVQILQNLRSLREIISYWKIYLLKELGKRENA